MSANRTRSGRICRTPRLLRAHRSPAPDAPLDLARPPGHARADQRLPAGGMAVRRHPCRDARGRRPHHRQGSRAPRPRAGESRTARPVEDHAPTSTPACSWCCRARSRPRTGTRRARCGSCSRATAPTPPSTASARPCTTGDFIITPPMAWHDHGNESDEPIFWLDGLDIPIVQFLDASFSEHLDDDEQPLSRPGGDCRARFGSNLLPVDHGPATARPRSSTTLRAHARGAGDACQTGPWDPYHGLKMRYTQPADRRAIR